MTTTHSVNTPNPIAARSLVEAIQQAAKLYGDSCDKTDRAWAKLDEAIDRGENVRRLDKREQVAVLRAAAQSQARRALDAAKNSLLEQYEACKAAAGQA